MAAHLQPGDILPAKHLPQGGDGPTVRVGPYRKRAQVLILAHSEPCEDCAAYLASLDRLAEQASGEKADVLAVVGPSWGDRGASWPVPTLVDDEIGPLLSAEQTPVVAVADRFGQLFAVLDAGSDHRFPGHDAILGVLVDIAIRCPECGVPDVPSLATIPEPGTRSAGMRLDQ